MREEKLREYSERQLARKQAWLKSLPPEELLKRLKPEERLRGLGPEERLYGLSPEDRQALARLLNRHRLKSASVSFISIAKPQKPNPLSPLP